MRWKLSQDHKVLTTGTGCTLNLSSTGILFDAGCALATGLNLVVSIAWPVLLNNEAPMQLSVKGCIVRCSENHVALRMDQHEFRTVRLIRIPGGSYRW